MADLHPQDGGMTARARSMLAPPPPSSRRPGRVGLATEAQGPIDVDSPFVEALVAGGRVRRALVDRGVIEESGADALAQSPPDLAELANLCFWTSLLSEEARPVRGTLCVCSPDQAPLAFRLARPEPASVKGLVALLTAAETTSLAVHRGPQGIEVWGILMWTPVYSMQLRIAGAGALVATVDAELLAVLQEGKITVPRSATETSWVEVFARNVWVDRAYQDRRRLAERLHRIVAAMLNHGRGGTMVIVPAADSSWLSNVVFRFSLDEQGRAALRDRIAASEQARDEADRSYRTALKTRPLSERDPQLLRLRLEAAFSHAKIVQSTLDAIGELSAVDGALVLDDELSVIGFGAKLHLESAEFMVSVYSALGGPVGDAVHVADLGGMRHQSAARFVYEHPRSVAVVVSQDRRVTLFVWKDDARAVVAVRGMEHFVATPP